MTELNIGLLGHVDHGKTTLVDLLTGKWVDTFSEEKRRGITIRLGYADFNIYKCSKCSKLTTSKKCINCFSECVLQRTFSLIDAPGHESLIPVVLSGSSLFDAAILVIAANETCPQPQTLEHLRALEVGEIRNIIIVQNKIDLVSKEEAMKNYKEIKEFVKDTIAENSKIIPMSAQQGIGLHYLLEELLKIPKPKYPEGDFLFLIARSFDANKPGNIKPEELKGGIIGGSVIRGKLTKNEDIVIKPVYLNGKYIEMKTKVRNIKRGDNNVEEAQPGGLVALETSLDPYLTKSDKLVGCIAGTGKLPETTYNIVLEYSLFESYKTTTNDTILITYRNSRSTGVIRSVSNKKMDVNLKIPLCIERSNKVGISKLIDGKWRLIGWGIYL